jgi:hypothetical protein
MVAKLSTTIEKIQNLPNSSNSKIINEFLMYMKNNGSVNNVLKNLELILYCNKSILDLFHRFVNPLKSSTKHSSKIEYTATLSSGLLELIFVQVFFYNC